MKLTINTDVLQRYNLSLGQFITLLASYYNVDCQKTQESLIELKLAERDLFKEFPPVISDNTKSLIAKIIVESDDKVIQSGINFECLAKALQTCYPEGLKAGKTYSWRGTVEEIAQKLRTLVAKYDFLFTPQEAINATVEYVCSFKEPYTYMHTLRNFLLYIKKDDLGKYEMESMFMSIIENKRSENEKRQANN